MSIRKKSVCKKSCMGLSAFGLLEKGLGSEDLLRRAGVQVLCGKPGRTFGIFNDGGARNA
jgi:hypothetical protein